MLKLLGVSPKGRKLVKTATKALKTVAPSKPPQRAVEPDSKPKPKTSRRTIDIADLPFDDFEIVGESNYQAALEKLAGPKTEEGVDHRCEVLLVCEPSNKFDKNAVRVEAGGEKVGYLSKIDAVSFREMLAEEDVVGAKVKARARITGGWRKADGEGHYGIALDPDWEE